MSKNPYEAGPLIGFEKEVELPPLNPDLVLTAEEAMNEILGLYSEALNYWEETADEAVNNLVKRYAEIIIEEGYNEDSARFRARRPGGIRQAHS